MQWASMCAFESLVKQKKEKLTCWVQLEVVVELVGSNWWVRGIDKSHDLELKMVALCHL